MVTHMTPIHRVPPELLLLILELTIENESKGGKEYKSTLAHTSLVCKEWRGPSQRLLNRILVFQDDEWEVAVKWLRTWGSTTRARDRGRIESLELESDYAVGPVQVAEMLAACRGVKSVCVRRPAGCAPLQLEGRTLALSALEDVKILKLSRVLFDRLILLPPLCTLTHLELVIPTAYSLQDYLEPLLPACNRLKALSLRAPEHHPRSLDSATAAKSVFFLDPFPNFGTSVTFLATDEAIVTAYPSLLSRFNAITTLVVDVDTKNGLDALTTTVLARPESGIVLTDFGLRRRELPLLWDVYAELLNTPAMAKLKKWWPLDYYQHRLISRANASNGESTFRQECSARGVQIAPPQPGGQFRIAPWEFVTPS